MNDIVSVIVPVYNVEQYLDKCLLSILNQTYKNLEIIIVDDGSSDSSPKLCDSYKERDKRITVIHKDNSGVSSARNLGMRSVTGDYITFVDPDDWLETDAIENMVRIIENEDVDCVRMNYFINTDTKEGEHVLAIGSGRYSDKESLYNLATSFLLAKDNCYVWLLLIKSDYLRIKDIEFNENVSMMEDTIFYTELLTSVGSIYLSPTRTYHYRYRNSSATKNIAFLERNTTDNIKVSDIVRSILQKNKYYKDDVYKMIRGLHLSLIASRLVWAMRQDKRSINRKDVDVYMSGLSKNKGFQRMVEEADLSSLAFHLRYLVQCMTNNRQLRLWHFIKLRTFMSKLKNPN